MSFNEWLTNTQFIVQTICISIDFFVQGIICYICWVQGSDTALNRFECYIWTDKYGQRRLRFKLIEETTDIDENFEFKESLINLENEFPPELIRKDSLYERQYFDIYIKQFMEGVDEVYIEENTEFNTDDI